MYKVKNQQVYGILISSKIGKGGRSRSLYTVLFSTQKYVKGWFSFSKCRLGWNRPKVTERFPPSHSGLFLSYQNKQIYLVVDTVLECDRVPDVDRSSDNYKPDLYKPLLITF